MYEYEDCVLYVHTVRFNKGNILYQTATPNAEDKNPAMDDM